MTSDDKLFNSAGWLLYWWPFLSSLTGDRAWVTVRRLNLGEAVLNEPHLLVSTDLLKEEYLEEKVGLLVMHARLCEYTLTTTFTSTSFPLTSGTSIYFASNSSTLDDCCMFPFPLLPPLAH